MLLAKKMLNAIKRQDWSAFIMEMLAVILGIAITFTGDSLIEKHQTNENIKSSLRLVIDELNDDLKIINQKDDKWQKETEALRFLFRFINDYTIAPEDSLKMYCNEPLEFDDIKCSKEALDLLKTSGLFAKIENKSLALDVIHAYSILDEYQNTIQFYIDSRLNMIEMAKSDDFKLTMLKPLNKISYAEFWNKLTETTDGKYFLAEENARHRYDTGYNMTRDSVQHIIQRIEKYCE